MRISVETGAIRMGMELFVFCYNKKKSLAHIMPRTAGNFEIYLLAIHNKKRSSISKYH